MASIMLLIKYLNHILFLNYLTAEQNIYFCIYHTRFMKTFDILEELTSFILWTFGVIY